MAKGIKNSGIPRKVIFLTTKLWNSAHHPDDIEKTVDTSLRDLDTDYIDLVLIHSPVALARGDELSPKDGDKPQTAGVDYIDTYKALEKVFKKGKVKAIGISNFSRAEVERVLKECEVVPAVHQMEMHPWLQQEEFAEFHRQEGIHVTHCSPLGNQDETCADGPGRLIDDAVLYHVGNKHGRTGAQAALAWAIARGHSVVLRSKTTQRIYDNLWGDFKLDQDDLKWIDRIDKNLRFNDSSESFGYNFLTGLDGKQ